MGTRRRQVRNVFIAQGVLIGLIGTAIGLVLGYALSWAGAHYHLISLAPEVYSIDYVPFAPRLIDGVLVALVAIGISFIATMYPSWSAAFGCTSPQSLRSTYCRASMSSLARATPRSLTTYDATSGS